MTKATMHAVNLAFCQHIVRLRCRDRVRKRVAFSPSTSVRSTSSSIRSPRSSTLSMLLTMTCLTESSSLWIRATLSCSAGVTVMRWLHLTWLADVANEGPKRRNGSSSRQQEPHHMGRHDVLEVGIKGKGNGGP